MTDKEQPRKKRARNNGASSKAALQSATSAPAAAQDHSAARPQSKTEKVIALLRRDNGSTLDELVAATGWLPHTTRAALTGLKKKGYVIASEKTDGVRRYRADKPQ